MHFIFVLILFVAIGCDQKSRGNTGTHATTPTAGTSSGSTSVVPVRVHGTTETVDPSKVDNNQNTEEPVHVFKYSGAIKCYPLVAIRLSEMEPQLTGLGIGVHSSYNAKDGKEHGDDSCYSQTGEMNVYVIDKAHLQLSESKAGFCECTPDSSRPGICVPYVYASAPLNGCRGIVIK